MLPTYKTLLVATDLTANSEHAFKHALLLARCHDARVYLLHVVPEVDASVRGYVATIMGKDSLSRFEKQHEEEAHEEISRELESFARQELGDHPEEVKRFAGVEVLHGHPAPQILQAADRLEADLIVVGTHGKGRLEYTFLGSVTEKLLRRTHRPVLVIPLPQG